MQKQFDRCRALDLRGKILKNCLAREKNTLRRATKGLIPTVRFVCLLSSSTLPPQKKMLRGARNQNFDN